MFSASAPSQMMEIDRREQRHEEEYFRDSVPAEARIEFLRRYLQEFLQISQRQSAELFLRSERAWARQLLSTPGQ